MLAEIIDNFRDAGRYYLCTDRGGGHRRCASVTQLFWPIGLGRAARKDWTLARPSDWCELCYCADLSLWAEPRQTIIALDQSWQCSGSCCVACRITVVLVVH